MKSIVSEKKQIVWFNLIIMLLELVASYIFATEFLMFVFILHLSLAIIITNDLTNIFNYVLGFLAYSQVILINGRTFNLYYVALILFLIKCFFYILNFKKLYNLSIYLGLMSFTVLYFVGMVLGQGFDDSYILVYMVILAMFIGILLIKDINTVDVYNTYLSMFCLSLAIGLLVDYIPDLRNVIRIATVEGVNRYTGLAWDTNFLALQCASNIGVLLFLCEKFPKKKYYYLSALIVVFFFGILTISKMYFLAVGILYVMWLLLSKTSAINKLLTFVLIIAALVFSLILLPTDSAINAMFYRIVNNIGNGFDFNKITTGRWNIWMAYLKDWSGSPTKIFFGSGVNYKVIFNGYSAHGFYVETLYQFGLVGTLLAFGMFYSCIQSIKMNYFIDSTNRYRKNKKNYLAYLGLVILLVCFAALSVLTEITSIMMLLVTSLVFNIGEDNEIQCDNSNI